MFKKFLLHSLTLFSLFFCSCDYIHADSFLDSIEEKDIGDVVEEVSDIFFPEVVGDALDAIIDSIEDRSIGEIFDFDSE